MNNRRILSLALRITGTVLLLTWVAFAIDFGQVGATLTDSRYGILAVVFAIALAERILSAWRLQVLLIAQGISLRLNKLVQIQMTTGLIGTVLPTSLALDVLRLYALSRHTARTLGVISASAVDRMMMLIAHLAAALVASLFAVGDWLSWKTTAVTAALMAGTVLSVVVLMYPGLIRRLSPLLTRVFGTWLVDKLWDFSASVRLFIDKPAFLAASFGLSLFTLGIRILVVKLELLALGEAVPVWWLAAIMPLAWLAAMLPVAIGSFGLREVAYVVALTQFGVSSHTALALSIIDHVLTRAVNLPGLYWFLRYGISSSVHPSATSPETESRRSRDTASSVVAHSIPPAE